MWYLYALLFWHLTLPVLTLLRDRLRLPGAAAGLVLAVGISLWAGTIDWPFTLVRVFAFYPFYAFGVLFRPQIDELARAAARFWAVRLVPAALLLAVYGWNFWQMMHYDGQLSESAKIFNDVAYGDGYGMPDRALFLAGGHRDECWAGGGAGRLPGICGAGQAHAAHLSSAPAHPDVPGGFRLL